jgi:hypothetical protein
VVVQDRVSFIFYYINISIKKQDRNRKGGRNVIMKRKKEKDKESHEKQKEKIAEKRLKRYGSIEGRSSSELESCVGFLGKVKHEVGCANVGENREGLGMVCDKGGMGLK